MLRTNVYFLFEKEIRFEMVRIKESRDIFIGRIGEEGKRN